MLEFSKNRLVNGVAVNTLKIRINYYKIICAIFLIGLSFSPKFANSEPREFQFVGSFGLSLQYAGYFGFKAGVESEKHHLYGAVGYLGFGIGYQYAITEKFAVGLAATAVASIGVTSVNLNYYFESTFSKGWVVGLDVLSPEQIFEASRDRRFLASVGYVF